MVVATEIIRCDANTLHHPHAIFYHVRISSNEFILLLQQRGSSSLRNLTSYLLQSFFFIFHILPLSCSFSIFSARAYYSSPKIERPVPPFLYASHCFHASLSFYFALLFSLLLHPFLGFSVSLFLLLFNPCARARVFCSF